MPRRRAQSGICHLCGANGPLSFEHVPPQAAYNNHRVTIARGLEIFSQQYENGSLRGDTQQGGSGAFTLCMSCNNNTGSWYGSAYVEWVRQALAILNSAQGSLRTQLVFQIHPLRILKQIACMFFSTSGYQFREVRPELERFVLDRNARGLPSKYRFYAYITTSTIGRQTGGAGIINFGSGAIAYVNEISSMPFGLVLTENTTVNDSRLLEITHFSEAEYNQVRDLNLPMRLLPVTTPYPLDYRSREEVARDVAINRGSSGRGNQ